MKLLRIFSIAARSPSTATKKSLADLDQGLCDASD